MSGKRVTIEDIAAEVGVTKGLVSRALTGKYNVSDKMRAEITRVAVSLGYDFGKLRAKNKKRSKCVLVMTSDMLIKESYWQPIIRSATETLENAHVNLEYFIYDKENINGNDTQKLKSFDASGYIFISHNPEALVRAAEETNRPIVVVDPKYILSGRHLQIKFNNFAAVYDMTKILLSYGHRHLCFYGPVGNASTSFTEREQGFSACISDHSALGVIGEEVLFKNTSGDYADEEKFEALLSQKPVTAVVCANDIIAYNAVASLRKLGKKVPDDVSVTGFDNITRSDERAMNLTTVNVPREELGEEAAKYLINHITNKQVKYSQIVIDCEIILRASVRRVTEETYD